MNKAYTCILCYVIIKCVIVKGCIKMKIIKMGNEENLFPKFQVKCKYCETEFEIEDWDDVYINDVSAFLNKIECGCDCPKCGAGARVPEIGNDLIFAYILGKPRCEVKEYINSVWKWTRKLSFDEKSLLNVSLINKLPLQEDMYRKHFMKEGSWSNDTNKKKNKKKGDKSK